MKIRTFVLLICCCILNYTGAQTQQWTVYNTSNSNIPDDPISGLDIDNNGNKWIGTVDYGLAMFDGFNWIVYNTGNSGLPGNLCFTTAFESNGDIWVGTIGGVSKFDGANWTSPIGYDVWDIAIDSNNYKWVTTLGLGLAVYDNNTWSYYGSSSGLGTDNVHSIEIDANGTIWIGTDIGLVKYDGINWTVYNTNNSDLPYNTVLSLAIDSDNNVWAGTGGSNNTGGLARFDGIIWAVFTDSNSNLTSNYINDVVADDNGNIWIATGGTQPGGLVQFDGDSIWTIYNNSNSGLPATSNRVQSIAIDSAGCIWVGTNGGVGVLCLDSISTTVNKYNEAEEVYHLVTYPNPFFSAITIEFENKDNKELIFSMYNSTGQLVQRIDEIATNEIIIKKENLPSGAYFFTLQSDESIINEGKLIIE